jgi:oxygen-independent coproporphyrinogen-3 oxidase
VAQRHFARVSFDLIYARPGHTPESWAAELARALALGTGHLSLYQLTIEPGTRFATLVREGKFTPLDDDAAGDLLP